MRGSDRRLLMVGALLLATAPVGAAEAVFSAEFDGETYPSQFASEAPGMKLVEFVRESETIDNWTKLLAVRRLPRLEDPTAAAAELVKRLNESNPLARHRLLTKEGGQEALIDFLTWPEDGSYMEFNVFRYVKAAGASGLISYQFAYRFSDTSPEAMESFKEQRHHWIELMTQATFPLSGER